MRLAVLADVHANLPAIVAVMAAVRDAAPDVVICLGDLVGYNASPAECIDLLRSAGVLCVAGNHDVDVEGTRSAPSSVVAAVQEWTRAALGPERREFLSSLPQVLQPMPEVVALHGSFLDQANLSGHVTRAVLGRNLEALRDRWKSHVGLCAHTHIPMLGWLEGGISRDVPPLAEVVWPATAEAVLVNPGSVGQPRDGNPWASFAIVDLTERTVRFERVPYDVAAATRAIERVGLPADLADRLRDGR